MITKKPKFKIAIPIYNKVDLLDVTAPYEIFNWMGHYWAEKRVKVHLIASSLNQLKTRDGLILTPNKTFADCTATNYQCDLLWVPGGDANKLQRMMHNQEYLTFLTQQSQQATYVTSVCEGALLLASAGLLNGYTATTHWQFIPCLQQFPEITVAEGHPRYVVDRNRVTGGGISSGLDEALELVARISSYEIAQQVQLVTQYFPNPPVNGQIPQATTCPIKVTP